LPNVPKAEDLVEAAQEPHERPLGLAVWVALCLGGGAVLWLAGLLAFRAAGQETRTWDLVWGLSGISFLFAFVPLPGFTSALLFALARMGWILGMVGVAGAAVGGTVAAGLLLALGETGRKHLRKRATKSPRARKLLAFSRKAAKTWTYAGVFVLLIPQFIPRAVVLYAAVLTKLRTVPFLAVVLIGTFARNLVMLAAFKLGWDLFGG
jgi:uncharacterized membrane protein YdjX (TVP38/TMEM64 family)